MGSPLYGKGYHEGIKKGTKNLKGIVAIFSAIFAFLGALFGAFLSKK